MSGIRVKKHVRRRPPKAVIKSALGELDARKADKNLKYACHIEATGKDSQIVPNGSGDFKKGECAVVNLEPRDVKDTVAAATTIQHEAVHAKDVFKNGPEAATLDNELKAHDETVKFLRRWRSDSPTKRTRKAIDRELRDEKKAIVTLRNEKAAKP